MTSYTTQTDPLPWQAVSEELLGLVRMLEAGEGRPANMIKFAEGYQSLAKAYVQAIETEGRTSMRAEAVVKALDLRTNKSALLTFLERTQDIATT